MSWVKSKGITIKIANIGNSLAVQWLGLGTFTAEGTDSIPAGGTKIPQAEWHRQKLKKKKKKANIY